MSSTVVKDVEKVNSIVWFRNDLRAVDHSGLSHAIKNSKNVIGVYCFNPHQFKLNNLGFPKTDSFKRMKCYLDLKNLIPIVFFMTFLNFVGVVMVGTLGSSSVRSDTLGS